MALTIAPPKTPRNRTRVRSGGKFQWTIHNHPNHAFSIRMNENSQTALVSFKRVEDAVLVGRMIEKHYIMQKEWPETEGQLMLPSVSKDSPLEFLFCRRWDLEDLKIECTKNILDMVSVDGIINKKNGNFSLTGNVYKFEAPPDFYRVRFEELYDF